MSRKSNRLKSIIMLLAVLLLAAAQGALPWSKQGKAIQVASSEYFEHNKRLKYG